MKFFTSTFLDGRSGVEKYSYDVTPLALVLLPSLLFFLLQPNVINCRLTYEKKINYSEVNLREKVPFTLIPLFLLFS